ncbi:MAG: cell division protein FtsW [Rhodospirillales bacterium]|nr:cell division protein FtsW [Alphaproteobacteria bacterium]MCB9981885.1 cell division protein FtsW [Rhodospirillales bacterium]
MSLFARTDQSRLGQWWWTVDRAMLAALLTLAVFGIAMVATASPPVAERIGLGNYHFLKRHLAILVPAIGMLIGFSFLSQRNIRRLAALAFIGSAIAMIAVLLTGMEIKGAQRWIHIFGFSLQPSEFIKPAFAVLAAWFMAMQKEKEKFPGNAITAGLYFLTITLLLLQPDLGMTVIVTAIWAAQIFLAGFPFRLLAVLLVLGIGGLVTAYAAFDHVQSRIDRYLHPETGDTYQIDKSLQAFQNGGLFGTGPGQGTVKMGLPDAHADFIFSVAAEEMGLVFVLIILGVYGFILLRGLNRLMDSHDMFVVLAVGGLLTMFGLQALVHMGSSLHLLPTKGMTLPLISYGGSSLLSVGFSMGIVLALTRRSRRTGISKGGLSLATSKTQGVAP